MRRILGAVMLFAVFVLPRAGGLIQTGFKDLDPTAPGTQTAVRGSSVGAVEGGYPGGVDHLTTSPSTGASRTAATSEGGNHVPSRSKTTARPPAGYIANPLEFLSLAPIDSLVLLPGIGPVIAERIANARTGKRLFTRWEDLLTVRGIGPKKLDRLKRLARQADSG
ncbi:MAG: helix-hairpin-helix domain-containing protein [Candidatus Latescibacterota bacterium]|nr:MAG: helix-hairpin-helix domain-containing protein [Candidatus Latescibacterota bacterium]